MSIKNVENNTYRPEFERYSKEIVPVKLGDALTIVGHPFATPIENRDLVSMALEYGLPVEQIDNVTRAIETTGFTRRYFSNFPGDEPNPSAIMDRTEEVGAILLSKTLEAVGWGKEFDVFIDTSAFLPEGINQRILNRLGINNIYSRSYRYACAGAIGSFIDCLSDPSLQDARIIIGALEPLSMVVSRKQFLSPETISFPAIFGDANTFIAFKPSDFHLESRQVLVQPDGGVIKLKSLYDFNHTASDPLSIPSHYKFENGGEKIFHHSENGAFLDIPTPEEGRVSMDGKATGFFFGDKTTGVIMDLLQEYGDMDLLKKLDGRNLIMHPASKPVVDRIGKLLYRGKYKYLDKPNIPFLMDKAGFSNGSSATTLNRWQYMIKNDLIDPRQPMLWIAPGIGSAIAGAVGWINA